MLLTFREYIATNMSRNECNETLTEWMQRKCDGMARTKMLRMNAAKVLRKSSNENVTKCVQWQRKERRQRTCFDMGPTSSLGNACFEGSHRNDPATKCAQRAWHETSPMKMLRNKCTGILQLPKPFVHRWLAYGCHMEAMGARWMASRIEMGERHDRTGVGTELHLVTKAVVIRGLPS